MRQFVGLDVMTHLHILEERGGAVLTAYNLSAEDVRRTVTVDLSVLGLDTGQVLASWPSTGVGRSRVVDGSLEVDLEPMAPLSPLVVEIGTG